MATPETVETKESTGSAEPGLSATRMFAIKIFSCVFGITFLMYVGAVLYCSATQKKLELPTHFLFVIQLIPVTVMAHAFGSAMAEVVKKWLPK